MEYILHEGWNIKPIQIKEIQSNVWKIFDGDHTYALKRSELKERNLQFICRAECILPQKGFYRFAELLLTSTKEDYFKTPSGCFTLHRWIEGEKCDFNDINHLSFAAETLGKFHLRSKEHSLSDFGGNRTNYFDRGEQIRHRIKEFHQFYERSSSSPQTIFTKIYRCLYPRYIRNALEAERRLLHSKYPLLAAKSAEEGSFIHYDVAARNFIIQKERAFLIDFDYCQCDLPLTDLARLIKRSMKQGEHYQEKLIAIIEGYQKVRKLTAEETEILYALLQFPQKFWRISHRYFSEKHSENEGFYIKKLIEAATETEQENQWLPMLSSITEVSL